jgi:2-oxoglutarate ferredoxin oxidoreductase subunit beta
MLATMITAMDAASLPVPIGIIYDDPAPTYEMQIQQQIDEAASGPHDMNALLRKGATWEMG